MIRLITTVSTCALLTACSGTQPFEFFGEDLDLSTDPVDPNDPNVSVNSKFAYDLAEGLTMNSVEYDEANQELVINNLPFDGPAGRYDLLRNFGGGEVYESRQTATTGQIKHYAVFLRSDEIEAAAAAGANWIGFGYGGANIVRDGSSFSLPSDGEYVYVGDYSAVRTFSDRSGLELVSGDVRILLDVNDFDPVDGIQGAIVGTISNREITTTGGGSRQNLENVTLAVVSFTTTDGTFDDGSAATFLADGSADGSGSFDGFFAGTNSTDIGANVVMTGTAYSQNVQYQTVEYSYTEDRITFVPGVGEVTNTVTLTGSASGLTDNNRELVQGYIDVGAVVPYLGYNPADLPPGATITSSRNDTVLFTSDFDAREIGVLVAER